MGIKNLGIYITIGVLVVGAVSTYAVLKYRVDETEEKVEEHGSQIIRMRELDIRQSVILEQLEQKL